jgi:hypothetical protein
VDSQVLPALSSVPHSFLPFGLCTSGSCLECPYPLLVSDFKSQLKAFPDYPI